MSENGKEFEVVWDLAGFKRALHGFIDRQIPFAIATAINLTLEDTRDEIKDQLPETFIIRSDWTMKGIRVDKASKRTLEGKIGSVDPYMALQATGGERSSIAKDPAEAMAIPIGARKDPTAKTNVSQHPGQVLGGKTSKGRYFLAPMPSGDMAVWKRNRAKRRANQKKKLMWVFSHNIEVKPRWHLPEILEGVVAKEWETNMRVALLNAIKTARLPSPKRANYRRR